MKTKQTQAPMTVDAWVEVAGLRRDATLTIPQEEWLDASTNGNLEQLVTRHFFDWVGTSEITFGWGEGGASREVIVRVTPADKADSPEADVTA